jgi:hypothetical protein
MTLRSARRGSTRAALLLPFLLALLLTPLAPAGMARAAAPGAWSAAADLGTPRAEPGAVVLQGGKVLVAGGYNASSVTAGAELYDPAADTWTATGAMGTPRVYHTLTRLPSGKVLAVGGIGVTPVALATAELYDPVAGTWSPAGTLASGRYRHTAVLLPGGRVLVAGGRAGNALASAEIYDSVTNAWTPAGTLATARWDHAAARLANGKVLVVGGYNGTLLASAELYDPATGTWNPTAPLAAPRSRFTLTLINGGALAVGGYSAGVPLVSELYDPVAGSWLPKAPLLQERMDHTAVALANGRVVVTGGRNESANGLGTTEIYDPASNGWSLAGGLGTPRAYHATVRLNSGDLLSIGGGNDETARLGSVERFDPAGAAPIHALSLEAGGPGAIVATPPGGTYPAGTTVTLRATPDPDGLFLYWLEPGNTAIGWPTERSFAIDAPRTVVAFFAARPVFTDVPANDPAADAIAHLAALGVVKGYGDGRFGPADTTLRAQMAALIVRAMGWDEDWGNPFSDRGEVDDELWRSVGVLAHYGVAQGYGDGRFGPTDPVLRVQVISFISRAMVAKGYWQAQPDDPSLFPNVPAASGHRADLATFVNNADQPPGVGGWGEPLPGWDQPATRAWFAQTLWLALDRHFGDRK